MRGLVRGPIVIFRDVTIVDEETYYQIEMPIAAVKIVHKALSTALEKWSGGEPREQEDLMAMRDNFYRIVLDHKFTSE